MVGAVQTLRKWDKNQQTELKIGEFECEFVRGIWGGHVVIFVFVFVFSFLIGA